MNQQQEEIVKYFQEFLQEESRQAEGTSSSTTATSLSTATSATTANLSSPVRKAINMALDENHITRRKAYIHCTIESKDLQVLKELRVDFSNLAQNDMDLRIEMTAQGWENYFARLHGPVYELLVKEFWRQAECDDHYVVSHVLGRRIVITEKSIAELLGLAHLQGLRVHGKEKNMPTGAINFLHKELYSDYSPEKQKKEYKVKTLLPKLRAWHRIILGCLNPRPSTNSADYINTNQKYMLYCLKKGKKLCLPFIIFHYLKEIITKSRTTTAREGKKIPHYIPFGRILSDILVESGLVDALRDAQCTEDLVTTAGDTLDARNLKKMGVLEQVSVDPTPEAPEDVLKKRMMVNGYPLWTKLDSPEALALYIYSMQQEGIDTTSFKYDDLPDCPPNVRMPKGKKKRRKSEGEEPKQKQPKKPKKDKTFGLGTYSESSGKGTSNTPTSGISISDVDTIPPSTSSQPTQPSPTSSTSQTTQSTQVQTPIFSSPIQTTTPPIVSIPEPIPLTHLNPQFTQQSDSEATLSNQSSESLFQDPPSPSTENLSKLRIPTSAPTTTLPPVLTPIASDTPMTEPISVNIPISESIISEISISEPLTSEPTTQPIPLAHLDASGNEVLISDVIPVVTLPSETSSSSVIILHQPIANNLEECINLFWYDALSRFKT